MSEQNRVDAGSVVLVLCLMGIILTIGAMLHSIDKEDAHIRQEISQINCRLQNIDAHIAAIEMRSDEVDRKLYQLKH